MANQKTPIRIFNQSLVLQGICEDYESASFERSFYEAGAWTVTINKNIPSATLFQKKYIVMFGSDVRDCGIVMKIISRIDEEGKGSQYLEISGYGLKYLFEQRTIAYFNDVDSYYLSGPAETVIKTLVDAQCGPSCTNEKRKFSLLTIGADLGRGLAYEMVAKNTQVYQECSQAAIQSLLGWYVYLDLANKKYVLECEEGLDRQVTQIINPYCLFSPDAESMRSAEASDDLAAYRNFVYVGGAGAGIGRTIKEGFTVTEPEDMERFEAFDDAGNLATNAALTIEAVAFLKQFEQTFELSGEVLAVCPYQYKTNYNVGDIVTVKFNDITYGVKILSVTEAWQYGAYSISIVWGKPIRGLSEQVGILSSGANNARATSESGTNVSGMRNGVLEFDLSAADHTMDGSECIYNVIKLSGTLTANRVLNFHLDATRLFGKKEYHIIIAAKPDGATPRTITLSAGGADFVFTVGLNTPVTLFHIFVDESGNIIPQNDQLLNTDDSPTFIGLTLSALTIGSVLFAGTGGVIAQDNTKLYWDNVNKHLGVGCIPTQVLEVKKNQNATSSFYFLNEDTTNSSSRAYLGLIAGDCGLVLQAIHGDHTYINGTAGKRLYFMASVSGAVNGQFDGSGNWAFGAGAPVEKCEVNSPTGGILTLRRVDASITANDMVGKIQFYARDTQTTTQFIVADIEAQAVNTITTDINPGRLIFRTTPSGVAGVPTEAMRLTSLQHLLVGTTDDDGTPATGKVVVKGTTNDGSTLVYVGRDSDEANVFTVDTNGQVNIGDTSNYLRLAPTGQVTLGGTSKCRLSMRPTIVASKIVKVGSDYYVVPTQVDRGAASGYSLPIYAANDEELFISEHIAGQWDSASDITVSVIGYLASAEDVDDDFALQLSWASKSTGSGTWSDTTNDTTVVTNIATGRSAQYSVYKVDLTVDWDLPATDVTANDFFAGRIRRVAVGVGNVEMSGEFVVTSIVITYSVDKMFKST